MTLHAPAAIIFDVGGTLLDTLENPQHVALRSIADLGVVDPDAFAGAVEHAVAAWWANGGTADAEDLASTWESHYRHALRHVGFPGDASLAAQRIEEGFLTTGWRVFPDVVDVLRTLSSTGIPLGIVSNWPPTLVGTLQRADLSQYFEVIVSSGEVGYAKPHRRIFDIAAERMGILPPDILYVGDDKKHDVDGATSAGMTALLLDRRGRYPDHPGRMTSLSELIARLAS